MTRIQMRSAVRESSLKHRYATPPLRSDYDLMITNDCKVYAPDGSLICALVREGMDKVLSENAYPALHSLRSKSSDNRGKYAGASAVAAEHSDGGMSLTNRSSVKVRSAIIGYYDRYPRIPFCRETAFTAKETAKWDTVTPLLSQVGELYKNTLPGKYKIQADHIASNVHPDFVIAGTPFTTITVNNCVSSSYHADKGDYKGGIGILSCMRKGKLTGSELVFPKYRLAVDLHDRDVLFFSPHAWHGNVQMFGDGEEGRPADGGWERITMVMYVREKMSDCGSAIEEAERAKRDTPGGTL